MVAGTQEPPPNVGSARRIAFTTSPLTTNFVLKLAIEPSTVDWKYHTRRAQSRRLTPSVTVSSAARPWFQTPYVPEVPKPESDPEFTSSVVTPTTLVRLVFSTWIRITSSAVRPLRISIGAQIPEKPPGMVSPSAMARVLQSPSSDRRAVCLTSTPRASASPVPLVLFSERLVSVPSTRGWVVGLLGEGPNCGGPTGFPDSSMGVMVKRSPS